MMPRDDDSDRPKKSWRERDAQRGKSAHHGRDGQSSYQERKNSNSQAYRSYKTQLNKLFDGGALPEVLKDKLGDTAVGSSSKNRKEALKALKEAKTPKARLKELQAFREEFEFPKDEEVLGLLLELDDEPQIVVEALNTISELHGEGGLKRASSLKGRIKTAQMTVDDDDVFAAAKALLKKL